MFSVIANHCIVEPASSVNRTLSSKPDSSPVYSSL